MRARSILPLVALGASLLSAPGSAQQPEQLPRVHILATGGTIASVYDPAKGGFVTSLSAEQLIKAAPEIRKYATITYEQVANIGSADMNPGVWLRLLARARAVLADPAVAGVVITHGTEGHRLVFYVRGKTAVKHLFPRRPDSVTFSRQRGEETEIDWHVRVR
jgi:L-asparaginase/Glu-tRNA(Gln) amidotransferase subunit D